MKQSIIIKQQQRLIIYHRYYLLRMHFGDIIDKLKQ